MYFGAVRLSWLLPFVVWWTQAVYCSDPSMRSLLSSSPSVPPCAPGAHERGNGAAGEHGPGTGALRSGGGGPAQAAGERCKRENSAPWTQAPRKSFLGDMSRKIMQIKKQCHTWCGTPPILAYADRRANQTADGAKPTGAHVPLK